MDKQRKIFVQTIRRERTLLDVTTHNIQQYISNKGFKPTIKKELKAQIVDEPK